MIMAKSLIDMLYKNNSSLSFKILNRRDRSTRNHCQQNTQYLYQICDTGGNRAAGIQPLGLSNWMENTSRVIEISI